MITATQRFERMALLDLSEVAEILEVTPQTIRNWVKAGQFPPPIAGQKYSGPEASEWLKGNRRTTSTKQTAH